MSAETRTEGSHQGELKGIHAALDKGARVHGFLSGGGLRVIGITINGERKAYGEHPHVEEALAYADEDFLAGGRSYGEVYDKIHPQYLTGSQDASGQLDEWLLEGRTFDAYKADSGKVIVELHGITHQDTPDAVQAQVKKHHAPLLWMARGFTFKTSPYVFGDGAEGHSTSVVDTPEGKRSLDGFMYNSTKTGEGDTFDQAVTNAFAAAEVEDQQT